MNNALAFLIVTVGVAVVAALLMALAALWSRRAGRVSVVDTVWGLGFVVIALVCSLLFSALFSDHPSRSWILFAMVLAWGGRLGWHVLRRSAGGGEDPRYTEVLRTGTPLRRVFLPQGAALWFVSMPLQSAAVSDGEVGQIAVVGIAIFLVGLGFEVIGDRQLAMYKADPGRGPVMDEGLWAWTRHPNYFGDAVVWWGIWVVAAGSLPGVLTVLSPLAMTYFLVFVTGARTLERTMMRREGYPAYAARTSMFVPLPPRR